MGSLILVRHAATDASETGRNLGQGNDPPLSARGAEQARRLGAALVAELDELPHDDLRLISSSALRCRQTAASVAERIGFEDDAMEVERGLLEIDYGGWEGLTADECRARDPSRRGSWEADPYRTRCPGGESGRMVAQRAFPVLSAIDEWLAGDRARCAIVVAHNHVNRLRLCAMLGWPMRDYRARVTQSPAHYSLVTHHTDGTVVRRVNVAPWVIPGPRSGRPGTVR